MKITRLDSIPNGHKLVFCLSVTLMLFDTPAAMDESDVYYTIGSNLSLSIKLAKM